MKVTAPQTHGISDLSAQKAKDKGSSVTRPDSKPDHATESVSNSASRTLNRIKDTIRAEPDIRADRVAEVKAKIKSGALKVDSEGLAEKMLASSIKEDLERP